MRLKQNSSTAIVVRKSWASLEAIQAFLRERPRNGNGNGNAIANAANANVKSALPAGNGHGNGHGQSANGQSGDDSHTIFARVLDDTDARGLWIELHTREHEQNAAVELQALMIPWHAVLAVVVANDFAPAIEEAREDETQELASARRG